MADLSVVFTPPGDFDWAYDPQREALHFISQSNAALYTYSLEDFAFKPTLVVGGTPSTIAIAPDGQNLFLGNATAVVIDGASAAVVTRVNLSTHAVDQVTAVLPYSGSWGVAHIAVTTNGKVIFDTLAGASHANTFFSFMAASPAPAGPDSALAVLDDNHAGFAPWSHILSSPNHRYLVLQEPGVAPSRLRSMMGALIA